MAKVVWTKSARENLRSIAQFISEEAPDRAERKVRQIYGAVGRLESFPESGRVVPEIDEEGLREILVDKYRVIYRVADSSLFVLAVIHGRQDFAEFWRSRTKG